MLVTILFLLIFSLLLLHEMDAIRTKEWRMFIILKDMKEQTGYLTFSILHLPLYFIALLLLAFGGMDGNTILFVLLDVFLVLHAVIHFCFRHHKNNGFTSFYSKTLIILLGVLSLLHLLLLWL